MHCISIDESTENRGKINTVYVIPVLFFSSLSSMKEVLQNEKNLPFYYIRLTPRLSVPWIYFN